MKIAVPSRGNVVDDHFGHCKYFSVFTIENNSVVKSEEVPSAQGCGCKSNIVNDLKAKGVELMLAGNMGQGAYNKITNANIKVIRGCAGNIQDLMQKYLDGKIEDTLIICDHHNAESEDHQCNH